MGTIRNKHIVLWCSGTVWALLFSAGAAFDWYEEPARPLSGDMFYQNYNVEAGPGVLEHVEEANKDAVDAEMNRALLLYKILQSLKLSRDIAGRYYRPNSDAIDYVDFDRNTPVAADRKIVAKRIANPAQPDDEKNSSNGQAQSQSKPANVKATRAPAMCYLKLCSFHVFN